MGGVGHNRKILPNLSKRIRPLTALFRKGATCVFTPATDYIVRQILAELAAPPILSSPGLGYCSPRLRPVPRARWPLHRWFQCLEKEQPDDSGPIAYISLATLDSERR